MSFLHRASSRAFVAALLQALPPAGRNQGFRALEGLKNLGFALFGPTTRHPGPPTSVLYLPRTWSPQSHVQPLRRRLAALSLSPDRAAFFFPDTAPDCYDGGA